MTVVDDNGMQDWVADYTEEGGEAELEDGGGGQRQRRTTTTAMADDDNGNGGRQQQQTTTAAGTTVCKIGWKTMRRKEESGQGTTTALGRKREKINKSSLCKKTFF
jgi:hypothetical protein